MGKASRLILGCLAVVLFAIAACAALYIHYSREWERVNMEYLAEVGHVAPTYHAVHAFLQMEFPQGMASDDVLAHVYSRFVCHLEYQASAGPESTYWFAFPTGKCGGNEFLKRECPGIMYRFDFENGSLQAIKRVILE